MLARPEKSIAIVAEEEVENVLGVLMVKLEYIGRGRRYASIEPIFESLGVVTSVLTMTFKNDEVILLPTYMGKRTVKIKTEDIPLMFGLWRW